jgi:hypothetical protein
MINAAQEGMSRLSEPIPCASATETIITSAPKNSAIFFALFSEGHTFSFSQQRTITLFTKEGMNLDGGRGYL